ncbi:hypothetical protein T265_03419 [Opisthorchis viverrini]|uniref:Alpha-MPP n=2 Tax=Opisthorchis viverrini TaxID=6198 RepID=A0A075A392_OPIVI|nr:hypothetical protein T265_03419 [Opisthorchis viverrini]KER30045.1 hypothetical protein T265_03419 [Opisthorchis viverrini]
MSPPGVCWVNGKKPVCQALFKQGITWLLIVVPSTRTPAVMLSLVHRVSRCVSTRLIRRNYFCSSSINAAEPGKSSLRDPLPLAAVPQQTGKSFIEDKETRITTLENGLRIASQDRFGAQCAIGVILDAGPRYEVDRYSGISHYLEKLAFHSSDHFKDRNDVQNAMEQCSAVFDCQISRDFIIYAVSGLSAHMDRMVSVLSETVLRPRITEDEVQMADRSVRFEMQALQRAPPVEPIMNELLHSAAYRGDNTLGLPRYCPEQNFGQITRDHIISFIATYYRPERMVIAGAGVPHDAFVTAVEKAFVPFEHSLRQESAAQNPAEPDSSVAQYMGGYVKIHRDLSQYHAPMPELAHAAIGFESCAHGDPHFVPACVLQSLLGGGGSFSAGGPGKGMYSRLYLNVLNRYHWVHSAQAENFSYADSGLFSIRGSAEPENLEQLVFRLAAEMRHTLEAPIGEDELARAKAQLKSMLLGNLETCAVVFEDIARQVLSSGHRPQPEYWVENIDKVTAEDLKDFLHRMFYRTPATVVGFGRVDRLPEHKEVLQILGGSQDIPLSQRLPGIFKQFI